MSYELKIGGIKLLTQKINVPHTLYRPSYH